jgi:hypothetical protein
LKFGIIALVSNESSLPAWNPVTQIELADHLASGAPLDLRIRDETGRTVFASLLRAVLIDEDLPHDPRGLTIVGARIPDQLDLSYCTLPAPLCLRETSFDSVLTLVGATIEGELNMTEATLDGKDDQGNAVVADGMQVNGNAILPRLRVAKGAIRLANTTITGVLELTGAELDGQDSQGNSLVADRMRVDGGAFLSTLSAEGVVRLLGATIAAELNLTAANLNGKDNAGIALVADGLQVNGNALLERLHVARGTVFLAGATITGQLNLSDAELDGTDKGGNALVADGLHVNGGAFLKTLRAEGAVRLTDAVITGQLNLTGATLNGKDARGNVLMADRVQVSGDAALGQLRVTHGATISLQDGRLGNLALDREVPGGGWPRNNFVGLRYDQIDGPPATSARQGARLLASQADGSRAAQPYWQLADYYARVGNDSASRRLRVWSNVLQAKAHPRSWPRFVYGLTTGFGYYPFLALVWLVLLIGVDTVALAAHRDDFIPTSAPAVAVSVARDHPPVTSTRCDPRYPCFNPVLYATDTVVPVISMGQQDAWRLDTSRAGTSLQVTLVVTTALGWILTTLLVGGVGGLLRRS